MKDKEKEETKKTILGWRDGLIRNKMYLILTSNRYKQFQEQIDGEYMNKDNYGFIKSEKLK
jgi:hypothetical protein